MGVDLDREQWARLAELRVAAIPWRVRGLIAGDLVVDSSAAVLVWEPRRVTPVYAVPREDVLHDVVDGGSEPASGGFAHRPVLDPSVPFAVHTAAGVARLIRHGDHAVEAFEPEDPIVGGRLLIDFEALDWMEEDDPVVAHPRDPFHRIDVHRTGRHLVLSVDGVTVVDTVDARMLAETNLPVRWYVPAEDVRVPLQPTETVSWCAYKGRATYSSAVVGSRVLPDIAWTYSEPLRDAGEVRGLLAFFAERMTGILDGVPIPRRGLAPPPSATAVHA